ncbi:Rnase Y domain-containing protein [Mangrovactinospora gilvigrisea]|uniref:Rnase Y domain-containing protein n=1 Tax=Mangrovactinospora gilvigrisea TaxID=1428644 RepID=UPI000A722510|nr:Rnase Y domain-containing protein [Mangrovactinospora gilvigrisea]
MQLALVIASVVLLVVTLAVLAAGALALQRRHARLAAKAVRLDQQRTEFHGLADARREALERIAGLTAAQARAELVREIEQSAKREAARRARELEDRAREEAESRARAVVATAIQRIAADQTAESTVSVLSLPSDLMKGRIIGREGRNIRAFEAVTGVNLIIDDTPEAVLLSSFDPLRREVARIALEALVADGRIHPHRIEEAHRRAAREVDQRCRRAAEDALVAADVMDVHPELVALLGRLRFRTSYGQNVLAHLVESAQLAGLMAAELGLDAALLRRCALLHDIGKALTQEREGSHALVGAEVAAAAGRVRRWCTPSRPTTARWSRAPWRRC